MASNTIDSISSVAVWGSLSASVVLGSFFVGQSILDKKRSKPYALLATVSFLTAFFDLCFPLLNIFTYEFLRLLSWPLLSGSTILLFEKSPKKAIQGYLLPFSLGVLSWIFISPYIATTVTLPTVFLINGFIHYKEYNRKHGFGSCILVTLSLMQASQCALYYEIVRVGSPLCTSLGYLHYALTTIIVVVLGWVNIPRELQDRAPVKVEKNQGDLFFLIMIICEVFVLLPFPLFRYPTLIAYASGSLIQGVVLGVFYFSYRHKLVIYTENITELLEQRTASLTIAQDALSKQNEIQALKLEEQATILKEKSAVIERQRRLELAAQTAGQAAHDIQNLVSPMIQFTRDLEKYATNPTHILESSVKVRKIISELLELNGQMLALSRRARIEMHPVLVDEILTEISDRLNNPLIKLDIQSGLWTKGSFSQLTRAITNLIVNGLESAPNKELTVKSLHIETTETIKCHLGYLPIGQYIEISVKDLGTGIPEEIQDKIFEPFFSSKQAKSSSGSGLGLSIVSAVIDDHLGVIDLKSSKEGTTFILYLPHYQPLDSVLNISEIIGSGRILVVDDDAQVRRQLDSVLTNAGYEVELAEDGRQALHSIQREAVDAIILDYSMPGLLAPEIMLGVLNLVGRTHIIIHSSFLTEAQIAEVKSLGAAEILTKPASSKLILKVLSQILNNVTP